jgi:hypothetical protein
MRLSGSFCWIFADFWGFCQGVWETKSLARLSDYDTTRGYVNGNFIWRYIIGSQHLVCFSLKCIRCFTSPFACHLIAVISALPEHARDHSPLLTSADDSSKQKKT